MGQGMKRVHRRIVQWAALLISNANLPGFLTGTLYKGPLKQICVPGLNCYSCPGAIGSCPIGALQSVIGSIRFQFSFYVTGLLLAFGLAFGRFVCGFLCPFGLLQELLHKVPFPRVRPLGKGFLLLKYVILAVFVIGMPMLVTNSFGLGAPAFCEYICPAGTLTAGLPLIAAHEPLRDALGGLFVLKVSVLLGTAVGCLLIYRFFCRYLCPLGALYALFNRVSLYRLRWEQACCTHCGQCAVVCKMGVDPARTPDSPECIRCGDCARVCPTGALHTGFRAASRAKCPHACGGCNGAG